MELGHTNISFVSLDDFRALPCVDRDEMESYDSQDKKFTNSVNYEAFAKEERNLSRDEKAKRDSGYKFDDRPEFIGAPWTSNGIQIKIGDSPSEVLPTYTNDARNCNCGLIAINTKGFHGNAVFHLNPVEYNDLQRKKDRKEVEALLSSRFSTLFHLLDNFIKRRKLPGKDVYVDLVITGGWSAASKKRSADCTTEASEKMRAMIEETFDACLLRTKRKAPVGVNIHSAKSFAFGQSGVETNLHYEPSTNQSVISVNKQRKNRQIPSSEAYSEYLIHELHSQRPYRIARDPDKRRVY